MNLLCPLCQKNVTIPDQHAGQAMACPLCGGNFRAPALPPAASSVRGNVASVANAPTAVMEVGPSTVPSTAAGQSPSPWGAAAPVSPGREAAAAPAPAEAPAGTSLGSFFSGPAAGPEATGHRRTITLRLNAQVLRVIPPLALLLVFILTFSPWLGLYPGDKAVFTQNAWQAAFGGGTVQEPEWLKMPGLFPESDLRSKTTANGPLIFYLLLLIAVVLLAIGSVVVAFLHPPVPEPVEMLLRWRSALVATATSVSFLLLVLQVSKGFSLENVIAQTNQERVDQQMKVARQEKVKAAQDPGYAEMLVQLGLAQFGIGRTTAYRLAVCLHLLAVICLLLECWLSWRGEGRPPPEVAFRW